MEEELQTIKDQVVESFLIELRGKCISEPGCGHSLWGGDGTGE